MRPFVIEYLKKKFKSLTVANASEYVNENDWEAENAIVLFHTDMYNCKRHIDRLHSRTSSRMENGISKALATEINRFSRLEMWVHDAMLIVFLEEDMDLFEVMDLLPPVVQDILDTFDEDKEKYAECERVVELLEKVGWTADYGLSGTLFNLEELKSK